MPKKKSTKLEVVYSMDYSYKEYNGPCDCPLYSIIPKGSWYSILYHGCCEVHSSSTLDEALSYIHEKMDKWLALKKWVESK